MTHAPRSALPLAALALAACARTPVATAPARDPGTRRAVVAYLDSAVASPAFRASHWGILIVDPDRADTLYSRNAGKLFMPASNQKILTGATALARLGPDFRFRTDFLARGTVRRDTLFGDLVVVGRGDPTLSDRMRRDAMIPMRELADSLRAHGVTHVTGRVLRGGDAFPDSEWGFGWALDDFPYSYGAGVDELLFNEGFAKIHVRGGARPGAMPIVTVGPTPIYPNVVLQARTGASPPPGAPSRPRNSLDVAFATGLHAFQNGLVLTGEIAPGDTVTIEASYPHVAVGYLAALQQGMRDRGIEVPAGLDAFGRVPATELASLTPLFSTRSPPLRAILPHMEKPSQNQLAEVLFKTLGLEVAGVGSADSGRRVVERQLLAWGAREDGFAVRDGSGLSRHDYLSPETIVRVLDAMRRHVDFDIFHESLPTPGEGTLRTRMIGTPAQGNVRAKTGTVDRARSLSGYVTTADGRRLLFSMLSNNHTVPAREVDRVVDETLARLAALGSRPSAPGR